jgi:hypothetical protein
MTEGDNNVPDRVHVDARHLSTDEALAALQRGGVPELQRMARLAQGLVSPEQVTEPDRPVTQEQLNERREGEPERTEPEPEAER